MLSPVVSDEESFRVKRLPKQHGILCVYHLHCMCKLRTMHNLPTYEMIKNVPVHFIEQHMVMYHNI
jgi:hypothetical protein